MKKMFVLAVSLVLIAVCGIARGQDNAATGEYSYIGTKKCKKCHLKQYKSWAQTKMANVYDLLKPGERAEAKTKAGLDPEKDYTQDPECLPCHTTGYGKPGGFVSLEKTPELAGVSCEMCHGAGSEYTREQFMSNKNKNYKRTEVAQVGLINPPTAKTCTELCHNEKSPFFKSFDFEKRKDEGTHEHFPLKYEHE
jgi:hypothetical protein